MMDSRRNKMKAGRQTERALNLVFDENLGRNIDEYLGGMEQSFQPTQAGK